MTSENPCLQCGVTSHTGSKKYNPILSKMQMVYNQSMSKNDFVQFWLPFLMLIALNLYAVLSLFFYVMRHRKKKIDEKVLEDPRQHSFFLHHLARKWWIDKSIPVEKYFVRKKIHPNILSYCSLILNIFASLFFASGIFGIAGWLILFAGAFDSLDGRVARAGGRITSRGAFLDSTLDRYSDILIFSGILVFFRETWVFYLIMFSILGSVIVSYARARGQSLGIDFNKGAMQRPERIVYLAAGAVLDPVIVRILEIYGCAPYNYFFIIMLSVVTVLVNGTAIYRCVSIYHSLSDSDQLDKNPKSD
jgi:phosphatidylglycerophosphate synthase